MDYFERLGAQGHVGDVIKFFRSDDEILDVGCGTGWLAEHFVHYRGIESHPGAVEHANSLGRAVDLGDVGQPLPYPDCSFDGVILKDVLEHVLNPLLLTQEAYRTLRPGGVVYASSPDAQRWVWVDYSHRRPFPLRAYRELFADAGFRIQVSGYQTVIPGSGIISGRTRDKRRPALLRLAGRVPFLRRNTYIVATRPRDGQLTRAKRNGSEQDMNYGSGRRSRTPESEE